MSYRREGSRDGRRRDDRRRSPPPRDYRDDPRRRDTRSPFDMPPRSRDPRDEDYERRRYEDEQAYRSRYGNYPLPPPAAMYYDPRLRENAYGAQDVYRSSSGGAYPSSYPYAAQPMAASGSGSGGPPPLLYGQDAQKSMSSPTQSVILLGLPPSCDEAMLRAFLEQMGCAIDQCTVIYDRNTGQSKRFGFARFVSVEHARAFVEPNFPAVVWKDKTGRGLPEEDGFRLKIDFAVTDRHPQMKPPASKVNPIQAAKEINVTATGVKPSPSANLPPNDGTRDIGPLPNSLLLLRGLDPLTRESEIASALDALAGVTEAQKVRQVMHIKDRSNKSSQGFAFVAYKDAKVAADVLSKIWDPETNPQGWRIRGHVVTVTFAHNESFRPAYASSSWSFKNEAGKELLYWDERAFVSAWTSPLVKIAGNETNGKSAANGKHVDDADEFLASFGLPEGPTTTEPEASTSVAAAPENTLRARMSLSQEKGLLESKGTASSTPEPTATTASTESVSSLQVFSANDERSDYRASASTTMGKKDKKAPELIASKKAASSIAKWNNKQSELHGSVDPDASEVPQKRKADEEAVDDGFPHANIEKKICLLCSRQFKGLEELKRHNELSNLHKENLNNADKVSSALQQRAAALGSLPVYRDRAAERRQAHNQPEKPVLDNSNHTGWSGKKARTNSTSSPTVSASEAAQGIKDSNIGHKMLAAAGWKEGEGLGNGRADPLQIKMYTAGAGLGAAAGVDAASAGGNIWNSSSTGRQKAAERFNEQT